MSYSAHVLAVFAWFRATIVHIVEYVHIEVNKVQPVWICRRNYGSFLNTDITSNESSCSREFLYSVCHSMIPLWSFSEQKQRIFYHAPKTICWKDIWLPGTFIHNMWHITALLYNTWHAICSTFAFGGVSLGTDWYHPRVICGLDMEALSALLAICERNPPATGRLPSPSLTDADLILFLWC